MTIYSCFVYSKDKRYFFTMICIVFATFTPEDKTEWRLALFNESLKSRCLPLFSTSVTLDQCEIIFFEKFVDPYRLFYSLLSPDTG